MTKLPDKMKAAVEAAFDANLPMPASLKSSKEAEAFLAKDREHRISRILAAVASGMEEANNRVSVEQAESIIATGITNGDHPKTIAMKIVSPATQEVGLRTLTPRGIMDWVDRSKKSLADDPRKIRSSLAPAQGTDGKEWMREVANRIHEAYSSKDSYCPGNDELVAIIARHCPPSVPSLPADEGTSHQFPDIGVDPLTLSGDERTKYREINTVRDRLMKAVSVQQKGVPDQTALVWRVDLDNICMEHVWLQAVRERLLASKSVAAAPKGDGLSGSMDATAEKLWEAAFQAYCNGGGSKTAHERAAESVAKSLTEILTSAPACVPAGDGRDKERLDWLDQMTAALNAKHETTYGWRVDWNHNRTSLSVTDCNLPPLSVRAAIDAAQSSTQQGGTSK